MLTYQDQKKNRYRAYCDFLGTEEYSRYKECNRIFTAATLGPQGSSSDETLQYFNEARILTKKAMRVSLYPTFEELKDALVEDRIQIAVVPHAYHNINLFYMSPAIRLLGIFIFPTPVYGLARRRGSTKNFSDYREILTHPAPVPLMDYLLPKTCSQEIKVRLVSSTSQAAILVSKEFDELAITNEQAVSEYGLEFIKTYGEILMSWSVFGRGE